MESNLVAEFMVKTGATSVEAHSCLQAKRWDLKLAIRDYLSSKESGGNERPLLTKCDSIDVTDSFFSITIAMSQWSPRFLQKDSSLQGFQACAFLPSPNLCPVDRVMLLAGKSKSIILLRKNAPGKKLSRGISRATDNVNLVNKARTELGLDSRENGVCNVNKYFIETPVFTFTLPDLSIFSDDFRQFLEKDLIEMSSLFSLEQAGRLNWWANSGACQRLWPLATTGDGNCLLHAASLGMWGFHDRLLTLRRALHEFLSSSDCRDALWRRWRWQLTRFNAEAGLVYTEEEWRKEWNSIVSMASSTPRNSGSRRRSVILDKSLNKEVSENATYESLEEIHVLALAHVLKRPIIVIADTMLKDVHGEALAPILFGGIYLPLEIPSSECHRSPLVLTYDAAHFSALVVMDKETFADKSPQPPAVIPLTDSQHKLLPVQFSVDPGEDFVWGRDENLPHVVEKLMLGTKDLLLLLKEYLNIVHVPVSLSPISDDGEYDVEVETPCDEEDIEKRFFEVTDCDLDEITCGITDSGLFGTNKSRAAKQLQSVAKQFGSIGKSVSKKLKKNLGTITKMTRTNSQKKDCSARGRLPADEMSKSQDFILSARLHPEERHEYQEEMIKNYLNTARDRFEREKKLKQKLAEENSNLEDERLQEQAKLEGPKNCIIPGCNMYGTVLTSYLCDSCYEKQREEELTTSINSPSLPRAAILPQKLPLTSRNCNYVDAPRYGTGRSTFYTEATPKCYENAKNFSKTAGRTLKPTDETLYLSNSTFYNDKSPKRSFYPKDWKSSPAGTNKGSQYNAPIEYQNRNTWQDDGSAQAEGGASMSVPAGFSAPTNRTSWNNDSLRRIQSYNLARETFQANLKSEGSQSCSKSRNSSPGTGSSITVSNITPLQSQSKCKDLPEIENVSRKSFQSYSKPVVSENFVTTIPVRQSSQNSLDQLLRETTEYLSKNSESQSVRLEDARVPAGEAENPEKQLVNGCGSEESKKQNEDYIDRKMCLNVTCKFFGSPDLENYCSQCYRGRFENLGFDTSTRK